ncbi:MAG: TAXI family TRAP transporter solute-binding subunit [Acetivibrionales bacterium]
MKRKIYSVLTILMVATLVLSLVGCNPPNATPATSSTPASSEPTASSAAPSASQPAAPSKETVSVALATSSSGSSPYKLGSIISNVINTNQSAVSLSAQVTAGFNENLFMVASGEIPVGMTTAFDLHQAYNENDKYANNPEMKNLRRLGLYAIEYGHQIVRADSDIKTIYDLKGKKVNMNTPASITAARNDMIFKAFGMTREDFTPVEIATSGAMDAIRDRIADATFNGMSAGNSSLFELSNEIPVRLLEIPEAEFEKLNSYVGGTFGYGAIPGGTYKGQDTDVYTWMGYNLLFAHKDTPDDVIYEITKTFWENLDDLAAVDTGFALLKKDMATYGPESVPLHPGAERYLKEVGFIK